MSTYAQLLKEYEMTHEKTKECLKPSNQLVSFINNILNDSKKQVGELTTSAENAQTQMASTTAHNKQKCDSQGQTMGESRVTPPHQQQSMFNTVSAFSASMKNEKNGKE